MEAGYTLLLADADTIGIACDETTTDAEVLEVAAVLAAGQPGATVPGQLAESGPVLPAGLARSSGFLGHPVFHEHRSETAMLRYLRRLADFDIALDRSMIPLGSCTMKLNAAAEMEAVTWPEFADLHPFGPAGQAAGYDELISDLERWLAEITGYDAVSVQPNAGSQGELAGLLAIRGYHSLPRRRRPGHLPDPRVGARDQRGQRGPGGPAGRGGQVRPRRRDRPRPTCTPSWSPGAGRSPRSC